MRKSLPLVALLFALCGCHHDLTGVYAGDGNDGDLYVVHLVETSGRAQGHYQHFSVDGVAFNTEEGAIEANEDDGKLAGTYKSSALVAQTVPISGAGDGNRLTIDGSASLSSLHLDLARTDEADVASRIDALKKRVEAAKSVLQADRAAQDRDRLLRHVRDAIVKEDQFAIAIDKTLPYLRGVTTFWQTTTKKMWDAVQRQNYMTDVNAKAALAAHVREAGRAAAAQHDRLAGIEQNILNNDVERQVAGAAQDCSHPPAAAPADAADREWNAACQALQNALQIHRDKMDAFRNAVQQTEAIWTAEHQRQDEISAEAAHPR